MTTLEELERLQICFEDRPAGLKAKAQGFAREAIAVGIGAYGSFKAVVPYVDQAQASEAQRGVYHAACERFGLVPEEELPAFGKVG